MKQELEILEAKFCKFLNETIVGASKDYYKKQMKYVTREVCIIDDDDYEEYLKDYVRKEDDVILDYFCENPELNYGYKSLSNTEKTVIFLYFHENYRIGEIAKILNMNADYIGRLKKNALNKLKSYIERGKKNE